MTRVFHKLLVINYAAEQLKRLNDFNTIKTDANSFRDFIFLFVKNMNFVFGQLIVSWLNLTQSRDGSSFRMKRLITTGKSLLDSNKVSSSAKRKLANSVMLDKSLM